MASSKNTRRASGTGSIHKKTVMRNGTAYTFWEAQVTVGSDPGTGKRIRKTFTGKTQKEVVRRCRTLLPPSRTAHTLSRPR